MKEMVERIECLRKNKADGKFQEDVDKPYINKQS